MRDLYIRWMELLEPVPRDNYLARLPVVQDYVRDSIIRFVTGDLNIEQDWDAYLNDLRMMGLEHFLEIAQTAYTRLNSYQY